jgi:hypothetical protein
MALKTLMDPRIKKLERVTDVSSRLQAVQKARPARPQASDHFKGWVR